ncbi:MAG: DUF3052 family protein [Alphaproteobacteria bacterium]|nr:DUF3052 family protein [Alphaproteobacteria bacterium]
MAAGYSGKPLAAKLGLKPGQRLLLLDASKHLLPELTVEGIQRTVDAAKAAAPCDIVHAFVTEAGKLAPLLERLKAMIAPDGMIWISWPKKASAVATDVTEDVIRAQALKLGLVDVKVCAVDQIWSGLKLVIPLKDRPKPQATARRAARR